MSRRSSLSRVVLLTGFFMLLFQVALAAAQTIEPAPMDISLWELARPVYDAFSGGRYALMGALIVVLLVALVKKFLGNKVSWLHTDAGGSAMALIASAAASAAAGLATPGATVTLGLLERSLGVGVTAAGGYAVLKNLVVEPILRPLALLAPPWAQPLFQGVFWIFDHPKVDPVPVAVTAGNDAVAAHPATGVHGVAGTPTDIP